MSPQPRDMSRKTVVIVQQQISALLFLIKAKRISLFTHTDHRSCSCLYARFDQSKSTLAEKDKQKISRNQNDQSVATDKLFKKIIMTKKKADIVAKQHVTNAVSVQFYCFS